VLTYLARADAREQTGDLAGALADYETARRLDPDAGYLDETIASLEAALAEP